MWEGRSKTDLGNAFLKRIRNKVILSEAAIIVLLALALAIRGKDEAAALESAAKLQSGKESNGAGQEGEETKEVIRWVDFDVSYEALCKAYEWDVSSHETAYPVNWVDLLAYTATVTGGKFDKKALQTLDKTAEKLTRGETTMEELTGTQKFAKTLSQKFVKTLSQKFVKTFVYYREAYSAVLDGLVGEYEEEREENGTKQIYKTYGLKAFFPLAKGFDYTHYDDFGSGRSYGYKRRHLGHDMLGAIGTPIICIETGTVEALGWNQYGGWRIGIRSLDKKRYYYYAHLRQNYPYAEGLEEGMTVTAGDVIGYMGHTGYSAKENVNNIDVTHLHWGLELIFDESQKDGDAQIWVDVYALTRFLAKHMQPVQKVPDSREWIRVGQISPFFHHFFCEK